LGHFNYVLRQIGGREKTHPSSSPVFRLTPQVSPSGPQMDINKAEMYFGAEFKTNGWLAWDE